MKEVVDYVVASHGYSQRRACQVTRQHRSTQRKPITRDPRTEVRQRMREIVATRIRYGYRRVHVLLRREGWTVGRNVVYRLYREEGLVLRRKAPRRRKMAVQREARFQPRHPNEAWSLDFVHDQLSNGQKFRALTVIDVFSREALAIEVGQRLRGEHVAEVLNRLVRRHGAPQYLFADNGGEFTGRLVDLWAYHHGVRIDFSRPGKPTDNAYIETFNGSLRDECLNLHWFASISEAQRLIEAWRREYNESRPHMLVWTASKRHRLCQDEVVADLTQWRPSMEKVVRIGMDTSKHVFQVHGVNRSEEAVLCKKLRRKEMIAFFEKLPPTVIGIESCGASHHWARLLQSFGHVVKLIPPQYVKPYVKRGKNDAADAEALCEAMSRPTMRFVPVKTAEQQAALMMVSMRARLIRNRTQLTNAIRGHAAEFGLTAAKGICKIEMLLDRVAANESLPELARNLFASQAREYVRLQEQLNDIEGKLMAWHRSDECSRRLSRIPGIGPIGASMLIMKTPAPEVFQSARHFAAWLGLTPRDHSTAGKVRLGGITRAGDEALRSVLVAGATAVIRQARSGRGKVSAWLIALLKRKPPKLVAVALANKIARIAWNGCAGDKVGHWNAGGVLSVAE